MTLKNYPTKQLLQELYERNDVWAFIITLSEIREYLIDFIEASDRSDAEIEKETDRILDLSESELREMANTADIQNVFASYDAMEDIIELVRSKLGAAYIFRD